LFLVACSQQSKPEFSKPLFSPSVCIEKNCFHTEIASTPAEREYGLMNRTSMPEQSGMIFIFEKEDSYSFWMKDTLIPLDMIRIDSGMNIVGIEEATPCTGPDASCTIYNPGKPASYVLEINYGISKKLGIQTGQKAIITK